MHVRFLMCEPVLGSVMQTLSSPAAEEGFAGSAMTAEAQTLSATRATMRFMSIVLVL
jgi:hypothetical protein